MAAGQREVLGCVGGKWSMIIVTSLGQGAKRFTGLRREIDGITARTLTATLRGLERHGIVTRTVHPAVPARVEYALTPMGYTLVGPVSQMVGWADSHLSEIEAAQVRYDARHASARGDFYEGEDAVQRLRDPGCPDLI